MYDIQIWRRGDRSLIIPLTTFGKLWVFKESPFRKTWEIPTELIPDMQRSINEAGLKVEVK